MLIKKICIRESYMFFCIYALLLTAVINLTISSVPKSSTFFLYINIVNVFIAVGSDDSRTVSYDML